MLLAVSSCKNDIIRITIYYLSKLRKKGYDEISLWHGMQPTMSQSICLRFNLTHNKPIPLCKDTIFLATIFIIAIMWLIVSNVEKIVNLYESDYLSFKLAISVNCDKWFYHRKIEEIKSLM